MLDLHMQGNAVERADCGPSGRPTMLAALLRTAPQSLPFELRMQVFRALVAADMERCAIPP